MFSPLKRFNGKSSILDHRDRNDHEVKAYNHRMSVTLPRQAQDAWLNPTVTPSGSQELCYRGREADSDRGPKGCGRKSGTAYEVGEEGEE
jgi:hypothetical protein